MRTWLLLIGACHDLGIGIRGVMNHPGRTESHVTTVVLSESDSKLNGQAFARGTGATWRPFSAEPSGAVGRSSNVFTISLSCDEPAVTKRRGRQHARVG